MFKKKRNWSIQESRISFWFLRLDLICAGAAAGIWWTQGHAVVWPIFIALTPWMIRLAVGEFPFQRTELDYSIGQFLICAGIGVWSAYQRETAWPKLWLIISSVFLFFALARQPRQNISFMLNVLSWSGAAIGLFFLLGHNWGGQPSDVNLIDQIGIRWMELRPQVIIPTLHPNVAGGILAVLLPYAILNGIISWKSDRGGTAAGLRLVSGLLTSILIAWGLLMSSSRAAWFALGAACVIWLGSLLKRMAFSSGDRLLRTALIFLIGVTLILIGYVGLNKPDVLLKFADQLPGQPSGVSRIELYRNTIDLIGDFLFSGGGLAAFPGLYSQYVMSIPHYLFGYSHNLYLDVALEQGILGLTAFLAVLLGSIFILCQRPSEDAGFRQISLLKQATWIGLLVMILHGFFDDPLYGMQGTPLLFLIPGMIVAIRNMSVDPNERHEVSDTDRQRILKGLRLVGVAILAAGTVVVLSRRDPRSAFISNLGSVSMSKIQLADFPSGEWNKNTDTAFLETSRQFFRKALAIDPSDRTANYRLGLISMTERDFAAALDYLVLAYKESPSNRGIIKNLGYCYAWLGNYEQSLIFLGNIPEAEQELEVYRWWWRSLGREDLSNKAQEMRALLVEG